jgi:hypothetical protein
MEGCFVGWRFCSKGCYVAGHFVLTTNMRILLTDRNKRLEYY